MNSNHEDTQKQRDFDHLEEFITTDKSSTIDFFRCEIDRFVQERGWKPFHTPRELAIALNIEAGELLENFLFSKSDYPAENKIDSTKEEIADVFIYLISLVNSLNMDLSQTVLKKLEKNKKKYPVETFHDGFYEKR
jgi:NTP pyrophosphatase (non-canonical NTP hydrolase)